MGKKYKNPPLVEALCEFHFEQNSPWDLVIPGLIYEKVRTSFPERKQIRVHSLEALQGANVLRQNIRITDRMQFLREDEKAFIQIGVNLLAVNHLKPYPSWEEFLPLIKEGFQAYSEIAKPKNIQRIGLRYINHIDIHEGKIDLKDYFGFRPEMDNEIFQNFGLFNIGVHIPYKQEKEFLKIELASKISKNPDVLEFVLDLNYFLIKTENVILEADNVFEWLNTAHDQIEKAFESCITQKLRAIFEEVKG
jgi:uncharacterized protein (TIGR04255 family)